MNENLLYKESWLMTVRHFCLFLQHFPDLLFVAQEIGFSSR